MEPIQSFISGQRLKIAELQDYLIDIIYDRVQPDALLYGGTAVWRCFGGMRFSEDIDIYMDKTSFLKLLNLLTKYGLKLIWQDPEYNSRIRIANNETEILLESKPGFAENEIRTYFRIDGTMKTISVFSPTELLVRKIEAYNGRKYIRDIYDIYILTKWLDKSDYLVKSSISKFLMNMSKPVDENILGSLLYSVNKNINFNTMIEYIKRWLNEV
ncbi:nucleotidyl transferase AbiEii/AbiGii toxin family protein [Ferroplasma sp.]|uniref:nucleotidyl transferase AbiEii/AbiGii toxin family protein n=1 Tax=Ferroplasma sp. TaxID=2591003 RepID=UPI00307F2C75